MAGGRVLCVIFSIIILAESAITQFKWSDCAASDPNRVLKLQELTATPMPLITPGPLNLHIKGEVARPMDKWSLRLDINRHTFAGTVHIPCEKDFGSCTYDGCQILDNMKKNANQGVADIATQVLNLINQNNIDISCPIKVQPISVNTFTINVPELGALANVLADGDYTVSVRLLNPDSGEIYGCISFDASLKRKCTGWLCHRRR